MVAIVVPLIYSWEYRHPHGWPREKGPNSNVVKVPRLRAVREAKPPSPSLRDGSCRVVMGYLFVLLLDRKQQYLCLCQAMLPCCLPYSYLLRWCTHAPRRRTAVVRRPVLSSGEPTSPLCIFVPPSPLPPPTAPPARKKQAALGEHVDLVGDNNDTEHGGVGVATSADAAAATPSVQAPPPSAAWAARRMHGTHHGSSVTRGGGGHQPPQRRPLASNATADATSTESSGGGLVAGRATVRSSTRMKVDSFAASGEGSARASRGAPARRTRPGRLTAQDGVDPADDADPASFGTTAPASDDAGDGAGGGGADGSRHWDSLSALRVAGGSAAGGGGVAGDATAAASTAKTGASRVPCGNSTAAASASETARVFGGGGGSGSGDPSHQRAPATRVVARRPSVVAPAAAASGGGKQQSFGGPGTLGGASKVGWGAHPTRVVGRQQQQHQHQRMDGGMTGRQGEEAGDRRQEAVPMRAAVSASVSVVLDRRGVLRQVRICMMACTIKERSTSKQQMHQACRTR